MALSELDPPITRPRGSWSRRPPSPSNFLMHFPTRKTRPTCFDHNFSKSRSFESSFGAFIVRRAFLRARVEVPVVPRVREIVGQRRRHSHLLRRSGDRPQTGDYFSAFKSIRSFFDQPFLLLPFGVQSMQLPTFHESHRFRSGGPASSRMTFATCTSSTCILRRRIWQSDTPSNDCVLVGKIIQQKTWFLQRHLAKLRLRESDMKRLGAWDTFELKTRNP